MIKKILLLLMCLPVYLLAWKMESGRETLPATAVGSSTWQTITLQQTYDTVPLIFVLVDEGSGYNGDSPVSLRVRSISTTSFEIVQVEPQSSVGDVEGEHAAVGFHYIAIEPGDHTLGDGTRILASSISTDRYQGKNAAGTKLWDSVSYSSNFSFTPIVLTTIQSMENESSILPGTSSVPWMTVTMQGSNSSGFDISLERAETSLGDITDTEEIGYLAVDAGVQGTIYTPDCTSIQYETIQTSNVVNGWQTLCYESSFVNTYTSLPNVIGSHNSRNGADGGWLRRCSLSTTQVGVTIDEDQAGDAERDHGGVEIAGLTIFEKDFVYDSTFNIGVCIATPAVDYRMDECYWLDSANGVTDDVKDSSLNAYNATSSGAATIITNSVNPPLCNYGSFAAQPDLISAEDVSAGNTLGGFTVSAWLKPSAMTNWQAIITKSKAYNWDDGWGLAHYSGDANNVIRFFVNNYSNNNVQTTLALDTWNHVVATYDNNTLRIYVNGTVATTKNYVASVTNSIDPLRVAYDDPGDDEYIGAVDEAKFWDRALSAEEVSVIHANESAGKNYDGTARTCPTCSTSIAASTWELIGIPADLRTGSYSVADVLSDNMVGVYGNDWRIYRRDYSDTNNSSWDTYLSETDVLEFGKGYWLGSKNSESWDADNIISVDYDSSNGACTSTRCVEVDLKSISLDVDNGDDLVGTGPYRYNLTGFVGKTPADWADCRFIIDGTAYTPSAAEVAGYVNKQIWQYNPGDGSADANGYTTCDDITPGGCKLEPYKGFWIELHGSTKDKTVKLLIPQE